MLHLHPLLAGRWSPARFDTSHVAGDDEVTVLLEAARWAPSAGNSQPWAFIVGRRGDATHARLVAHMTLQAQALGLFARQFRAFEREGLSAEFGVPTHWEVTTLVAIGRACPTDTPRPSGEVSESPARERKAIGEIIWPLG